MSDYKAVATRIELTDRVCLINALQAMGINVEENVVAKQRWSIHNRTMDMVIRQEQLPIELQGFGDLGLVMQNGKYAPMGISEQDSANYIDPIKRRELQDQGLSPAEARQQQPDGTFKAQVDEFFKDIENGYEVYNFAQQIADKCPTASFGNVQGDANDDRAWLLEGSVSASDLARLGIAVPQ